MMDHKSFHLIKSNNGVILILVRINGKSFRFPISIWPVGGRKEKDASANFQSLQDCVNEFFDEDNRNKLGFQGDMAIVNSSWISTVKDYYLFEVNSGCCCNHGGHIGINRGLNRIIGTLPSADKFQVKHCEANDIDRLFWFDEEEKKQWEKPLTMFFEFLVNLPHKADANSMSFGTAIHQYKQKLVKHHRNRPNPYRNLDRERRLEKVFGEKNYQMKEKESTKRLIENSDKKKRKNDLQIDHLAESLPLALEVARNLFKNTFPGIENYNFPTIFSKFMNEYAVEGKKLRSIMDETKNGQDSSLIKQLAFCLSVVMDTEYPLDNAISRCVYNTSNREHFQIILRMRTFSNYSQNENIFKLFSKMRTFSNCSQN